MLDFISRTTVASVVRPSIRPLTQISEKPLHGFRPNFIGNSLFDISPGNVFFFLSFFLQISAFQIYPLSLKWKITSHENTVLLLPRGTRFVENDLPVS